MVTGAQIRAARSALKLSIDSLSDLSGVSVRTLKRMESVLDVPNSNQPNLAAVKSALERLGIEFIGTPDDRPGIRIRRPKS